MEFCLAFIVIIWSHKPNVFVRPNEALLLIIAPKFCDFKWYSNVRQQRNVVTYHSVFPPTTITNKRINLMTFKYGNMYFMFLYRFLFFFFYLSFFISVLLESYESLAQSNENIRTYNRTWIVCEYVCARDKTITTQPNTISECLKQCVQS